MRIPYWRLQYITGTATLNPRLGYSCSMMLLLPSILIFLIVANDHPLMVLASPVSDLVLSLPNHTATVLVDSAISR